MRHRPNRAMPPCRKPRASGGQRGDRPVRNTHWHAVAVGMTAMPSSPPRTRSRRGLDTPSAPPIATCPWAGVTTQCSAPPAGRGRRWRGDRLRADRTLRKRKHASRSGCRGTSAVAALRVSSCGGQGPGEDGPHHLRVDQRKGLPNGADTVPDMHRLARSIRTVDGGWAGKLVPSSPCPAGPSRCVRRLGPLNDMLRLSLIVNSSRTPGLRLCVDD